MTEPKGEKRKLILSGIAECGWLAQFRATGEWARHGPAEATLVAILDRLGIAVARTAAEHLDDELILGRLAAMLYPAEAARHGPMGNVGSLRSGNPRPLEIRDARLGLDLTQRQLGERLGVSGETVRQWESGRRKPSAPACKLMAEMFDHHGTTTP